MHPSSLRSLGTFNFRRSKTLGVLARVGDPEI